MQGLRWHDGSAALSPTLPEGEGALRRLSFPRKRESRAAANDWMPAFAGMTGKAT